MFKEDEIIAEMTETEVSIRPRGFRNISCMPQTEHEIDLLLINVKIARINGIFR